MNKNIFITGEAKVTSLLRNYISARMDADFNIVEGFELRERDRQYLKTADAVIFLHEVGRCDAGEGRRNLRLTADVIDNMPQYGHKATIAYFTPAKRLDDSDDVRNIKLEAEGYIKQYCNSSGAKMVLYRMPEVFGQGIENNILNRLIADKDTNSPDMSYDFLHKDCLMDELYRMVNGAPALTGHDRYASPRGAHISTERELLRKFAGFKNIAAEEIPDFLSPFEKSLYDYYLMKSKPSGSYKISGDVVLASARFGTVQAVRLAPQEKYSVELNGACGLRLLLLSGSVKIYNKTYCADDCILRIDITKDIDVFNNGEGIAVIEIWRHTNS